MPTLIATFCDYTHTLKKLRLDPERNPKLKEARKACFRVNFKNNAPHFTTVISWPENDPRPTLPCRGPDDLSVFKWSDGKLTLDDLTDTTAIDQVNICEVPRAMDRTLYECILNALQISGDIRKTSIKRKARIAEDSWRLVGFLMQAIPNDALFSSDAGRFFAQVFNVEPMMGVASRLGGRDAIEDSKEFLKPVLKEILQHARIVSTASVQRPLLSGWAYDRKGNGSSSVLFVEPRRDVNSLKDTGKNRLLWVTSRRALQEFVDGGDEDKWLATIGQVVLVKSVSKWKTSVSPPLDMAKLGDGQSETYPSLVILEFGDIHQFINMHSCFNKAFDDRLCLPWLGYLNDGTISSMGDEFYGNKESRESLIMTLLRDKYNISLTEKQTKLIMQLGPPISVWNVFAGFGKSLLLAIAACIFHRCTDNTTPDRIVYVVAPTHETCADLARTLQIFFDRRELLQIRMVEDDSDSAGVIDLVDIWVRNIAHAEFRDHFEFLTLLDELIYRLSKRERRWYDRHLLSNQRREWYLPDKPYYAIWKLFSLRHLFLHSELYRNLSQCRKKSLKAVKVVVCTVQGRLKLKGNLSPWSKMLGDRKYELLFMDEMESVGRLTAAACLVGAHGAILSGDENQDPGRKSMSRQTGVLSLPNPSENAKPTVEHNRSTRPDPLHFQPVPEWAEQVKKKFPKFLDIRRCLETRRLGQDVVNLIKHLDPNLQPLVSCPESPNTLLCPVFVDTRHECEDPWQYAQRDPGGQRFEVIRSPLFFKIALAIVALEAVLQVHSCENSKVFKNGNILVMWSLSRPLKDFECFVKEHFTAACVHMERSLLDFPCGIDDISCKYTVREWLEQSPDNDL